GRAVLLRADHHALHRAFLGGGHLPGQRRKRLSLYVHRGRPSLNEDDTQCCSEPEQGSLGFHRGLLKGWYYPAGSIIARWDPGGNAGKESRVTKPTPRKAVGCPSSSPPRCLPDGTDHGCAPIPPIGTSTRRRPERGIMGVIERSQYD